MKKHSKIVAANNNEKMNKEQVKHIISTSYNRAIDNENALNKHYEAFSSETYGETSYERMQKIIEEPSNPMKMMSSLILEVE